MNGKSPMISHAPPFVLRLSKDERRVFQQNRKSCLSPFLALPSRQRWVNSGFSASIMYEQAGLSYMKEVWASSDPVRTPSQPSAVGQSVPVQSSPSPDAPARSSSYVRVLRGSGRARPSSRGRSRLFQARSSPDSQASVQAPLQRYADVVTHPPTDATVPKAPRLPSSPGGTVLRRSTDRGTLVQSGPCSTGGDPCIAPAAQAGSSPVGGATPHPHASAMSDSCRLRRSR